MNQFIRSLSPRAEFTIVVLLAFGNFIFTSLMAVLTATSPAESISEEGIRQLITYELVLLTLLGTFLWLRGWNTRLLGLTPTIKDTALGLPLMFATYATNITMMLLFGQSSCP